MAWGFPWARGFRVSKVSFWLVLYFHLMEEGEEKERKKKRGQKNITVGRRVSPELGPALLAVKQVTDVRYN
jgi:hypothetical protein